jgi:quercetin dioxygenase-like cupin family protein
MIKPLLPTHSVMYDGAIFKVFHANKGEGLPRHEHAYAHLTMCHAGSCVIRKEGIEKIVDKNTQPIILKALEWHEIEALEDNTVFVNSFSQSKVGMIDQESI